MVEVPAPGRPAAPGNRFVIATPDDFHVHLRSGPAMGAYARRHARTFGRALVMPNTVPPIASAPQVEAYRAEIAEATGMAGARGQPFEPLVAFKLLPGMSAEAVLACAAAGAVAGKYYPRGATTNSDDGVADPSEIREALGAMEDAGLVLSVHAEEPSAPVLSREEAFVPKLEAIVSGHPRLRMVVEHVSTAALLDFVLSCPPRVAAGVTAHHLLFTLDDLLGEAMDPALYCKPVVKTERDRDALREAVFSGERRVFFGSDSAPHPAASKLAPRIPAGTYSSPAAVPALAGLFESCGALGALESFLSERGAAFYCQPPPRGRLELEKREWKVEDEIDGATPMLAGKTLAWSARRLG